MSKLELIAPDGILTNEKIKSLRPKDREEYTYNVVAEILRLNPLGVTIPEVCEKTGFYRDTVSKHLEKMVSTREAYKIIRGQTIIYHKNGKVVHESDLKNLLNSNKFYTFYRLVNEEGNFIYIQEKEIDSFRAVQVRGGIMVNEKSIMYFLSELQKFVLEAVPNE